MTVPAVSVCPTCLGEGWVDHETSRETNDDGWAYTYARPCPECHCICGGPLGHRCELLDDIVEDQRMVRRADR